MEITACEAEEIVINLPFAEERKKKKMN